MGDIYVVIDDEGDAGEIGGGAAADGDEARHLSVARMLLLDGDDIDEARPAAGELPYALDAGYAGRFEIVPECRSLEQAGAGRAVERAGIRRLRRRRRD